MHLRTRVDMVEGWFRGDGGSARKAQENERLRDRIVSNATSASSQLLLAP